MIVTLTANPAVDITWRVRGFQRGESVVTDDANARAGGKGINVARVIHGSGHAVCALTTAGGQTGKELTDDLELSGIPHVVLPVPAPTRRTLTLVEEDAGVVTCLRELGTPLDPARWTALISVTRLTLSRGARVFVVSGSLPPESDPTRIGELVQLGREYNIPVIVDTAGPGLLCAARAGATILKPNRDEVVSATGADDPEQGARELLRLGAAMVFLSFGEEGLALFTETTHRQVRLSAPLMGNPTGAGDAAVAALAVLLAEGISDHDVLLRRAAAWSASAVLAPVAGDLHSSWPQLESRLIPATAV